MRRAGLRAEDLGTETGERVPPRVFAALQRDRDAIKAHLSWHHDSMKNPDIATIVERVLALRGGDEKARIAQLEADFALHEAVHWTEAPDPGLAQDPSGDSLFRLGLTLHPEWRGKEG